MGSGEVVVIVVVAAMRVLVIEVLGNRKNRLKRI